MVGQLSIFVSITEGVMSAILQSLLIAETPALSAVIVVDKAVYIFVMFVFSHVALNKPT